MGGADTVRGISYQHACTIAAALDVVADSRYAALRVEAAPDVIDFDLLDDQQRVVRAAQVKSRTEPYTISVDDLLSVFRRWAAIPTPAEVFEFLTDSQLNRAASLMREQLEAFQQLPSGSHESVPIEYALLVHLPPDLLRRIRIHTRYGETATLLDQAELKLLKLSAKRMAPTDAASQVNKLWRAITTRGGARNLTERTFSREELAGILGVDLAALESLTPWGAALANLYRSRLLTSEEPAFVVLDVVIRQNAPAALLLTARRVDTQERLPISAIPSAFRRCAIEGASGAGKSTALIFLRRELAQNGHVPVLLSPSRYVAGSLHSLVNQALEATLERALPVDTADMMLRERATVLLIDGFTERPLEERNELRRDLLTVTATAPQLRVVVAGRSPASFRLPDYPLLSLDQLTPEGRVTLAGNLLPEGADIARIVRGLERLLGDLIGNPLMFVMALSLDHSGGELSTRASVYKGVVDGMWHRQQDEERSEVATEVIVRNARALVEAGIFTATLHHWLSLTEEALGGRPLQGSRDAAERMSDLLSRVGFCRAPGFARSVVFLHDSFRDYFASLSYRTTSLGLPTQITSAHEASLRFLCEADGLSPNLALQLAQQNPVACYHLAEFEPSRYAADLALNVLLHLLNHIDGQHPMRLAGGVGVRFCWTEDESWIAVIRGEGAEVVSTPSALADVGTLLARAIRGRVGPLTLATRIWRSIAESAITMGGSDQWYWHSRAQRSPPQLIEALTDHARQREAAVVAIASTALPLLAERILSAVGPTGFQATLDSLPPGQSREHGVHYRYEDKPHAVEVTPSQPRDREQFWAHTSAESILQESPVMNAREALLKAFGQLLETQR